MLMGHENFVTVQISNENTQVQIHKPELTGDKVISSVPVSYTHLTLPTNREV